MELARSECTNGSNTYRKIFHSLPRKVITAHKNSELKFNILAPSIARNYYSTDKTFNTDFFPKSADKTVPHKPPQSIYTGQRVKHKNVICEFPDSVNRLEINKTPSAAGAGGTKKRQNPRNFNKSRDPAKCLTERGLKRDKRPSA